MNVEEAWDFIKGQIKLNIDKHVPFCKPQGPRRTGKPLWNRKLTREVVRKYKLWKVYTRTSNQEDFRLYTMQHNKTTQVIREARAKYEEHVTENLKNDPKALYKYIRSQQRFRPKVNMLNDKEGHLTTTDKHTAETLNKFFHSVFIEENNGELPELPEQVQPEHTLSEIAITVDEVRRHLHQQDETKAAGSDGIPAILLKRCAEELAHPLCILYQKSLTEGKLPREWKFAKITPIYKKGGKRKPENYRPVSLTSQPCKILERIIRSNITEHLELHGLLSVHQHGFVKKKSCLTNLLESFEKWTSIADEGTPVDVVYCDFRKAFDTVPHRRLLMKLSAYGLKDQVLAWLRDFLHNRRQQVTVGSSTSSSVRVTSGVPQGSV